MCAVVVGVGVGLPALPARHLLRLVNVPHHPSQQLGKIKRSSKNHQECKLGVVFCRSSTTESEVSKNREKKL